MAQSTEVLEAAILAELSARRGTINLARKTSLEHAREVGRLLVQLKDTTEHGEFVSAVIRCGLSERSAQRYMRLYTKPATVAVLEPTTITGAEAAVATPKWETDPFFLAALKRSNARSLDIPYHHRHEAENRRKVRAVDPELADKVDEGEVPLRVAMAQTRSARIAAGRTPPSPETIARRASNLDKRNDEERDDPLVTRKEVTEFMAEEIERNLDGLFQDFALVLNTGNREQTKAAKAAREAFDEAEEEFKQTPTANTWKVLLVAARHYRETDDKELKAARAKRSAFREPEPPKPKGKRTKKGGRGPEPVAPATVIAEARPEIGTPVSCHSK